MARAVVEHLLFSYSHISIEMNVWVVLALAAALTDLTKLPPSCTPLPFRLPSPAQHRLESNVLVW